MKSRKTRQKEIIEMEIQTLQYLFSAEELHLQLAQKDPKIGLATVYRFLTHLVQKGKIHSYACDRRTIYSTNKENHCHFRCEVCGAVKHLNLKKLDFLQKGLKGKVCHFQIDVTGTCEKCT